jgi:hypothetical protein
MQLIHNVNGRTYACPAFSIDDFGTEFCAIPGEYCRTDADFEARFVDGHSWNALVAYAVRDFE